MDSYYYYYTQGTTKGARTDGAEDAYDERSIRHQSNSFLRLKSLFPVSREGVKTVFNEGGELGWSAGHTTTTTTPSAPVYPPFTRNVYPGIPLLEIPAI